MPHLHQMLRRRDGIALIVSNVVGVGIFTTPSMVAGLVPNPMAFLALWLVGGALALAGAASYARLATLWPEAGGEYVYLSRTYGPAVGFLSGWTSLIAGFSGSVASSAAAVTLYAGQYFPSLAADQILASQDFLGISITISSRRLAAVLIIALLAALHICSLAGGRITQNALAVLLVGMVTAFLCGGLATGHGSWTHIHSPNLPVKTMDWLLALIPVMFSYSGWNAAAYVSEEIRASRRSIRPVLLGGTATVILLYTALNALYIYAMPLGHMRRSTNVAETAARTLFGAGSNLIAPVLIVALLGAISAMTIAGPRIYFAMARDGVFIPAFAHTSARFGTPSRAIALQALWSSALVLLGGFEHILMYTGFAIVLSSGAAVAGLFFVSRTGYGAAVTCRRKQIIPAVFVLASAAMVLDTIVDAPGIALLGVLLIAAGLPMYALCRQHSAEGYTLRPKEITAD